MSYLTAIDTTVGLDIGPERIGETDPTYSSSPTWQMICMWNVVRTTWGDIGKG